jgi:2-keto-4-pentenoate hydratase
MNSDEIQRLATQLISARRNQQPLTPEDCSAIQIDTREQAYAVQAAIWQAQYGATRPSAWKIGNGPDSAEPICAAMPEILAHESHTPHTRFRTLGIECEIAVRFARPLPPRAAPYSYDEVLAAIASTHVAIEIVDTALADYDAAGPLLRLADNMLHGSFVLGEAITEGRTQAWPTLKAQSFVNDKLIAEQTGGHPHIDPFTLLPWWANAGARRWGGVQAGDIVTTGTWNGMHFAAAPSSFKARFSAADGCSLGCAKLSFIG